ncbi:hypothetical protein DAPPUDRAFT_240735 [Daphnia pulex]|uniref:Uncharacterized protein n=1 Tax=Daphnia pulex TaxID=6669 RepID=E9GCD6_DAPPU|nr:hypothetical protein DAPPUDRAFT_240735 [Daphnia pulex]|eukprot:EFX82874.1 hypothetical protein DAPPUDRAFT_240735 [Daphnia pulex]
MPAQDRRLLFFSGVTLSTFFTKTVTFSVTVPLITLTTTTTCIPLALFAVPTQTSACRRKREISLDHVPIIPEESNQFGMAPSQTQEIILPTAVIPSAETNRLNRQVSIDIRPKRFIRSAIICW